jgi:TRAP-type C4-dicarboxylate transport system permease small subunit
MVVLAFLQVVLRNFFFGGFVWGDTLLRHLVLWLGFLGASIAVEREKHISIDIIGRMVPAKIRTSIRVITNIFATIISFFLAKAGLTFLQSEKETADILMTISGKELPTWWFEIIIPVGFGLISFHFFLKTIGYLYILFNPEKNPNSGGVA